MACAACGQSYRPVASIPAVAIPTVSQVQPQGQIPSGSIPLTPQVGYNITVPSSNVAVESVPPQAPVGGRMVPPENAG